MKNPEANSKEPTTCTSDIQSRWRSPSNIALVKYWGKKGPQIPANPSLSITLSACYTETLVNMQEIDSPDPEVEFYLDGQPQPAFAERLRKFCVDLAREKEFLRYKRLVVHSHNTFPHSAGIASSASGMSAFCLCLASLEEKITGDVKGDFFREASQLARRASGSASRSVYGGYVVWGEHPDVPGSSDDFAIPVPWDIHPLFHGLNDWIVVCDRGEKAVSSRAGHSLMEGHPFARERFNQAFRNISVLRLALQSGDWSAFAFLTEHEALTLHAMMLTSRPWFMLMKPQTLLVLEGVRKFREQTGTQICFTLDAGPNVHLLFPDSELHHVNELLMSRDWLNLSPENIIRDKEGTGPIKLS
ncbi:MAG: diphosphomevalonate decarboxylase [Flavobacteriales bacterium]|nr:diphosphomevalonate decarboxylase [Flavobacteriales bacterium]MCX7769130.1 diphosphomevalonate decarboxylase [Flavobacteriales bacterium]MDW8410168.1 diphosphomevalonate decarboxylase [Flavobacteriales bacterium]